MRRLSAAMLAIISLSVVHSFAQSGRVRAQATSVIASTTAPTPQQSKPSEYPFLPETLMTAEFEIADDTTSILPAYKGKVLVVNLWGIWCGPCRDEMPHLQKMFDTYHTKGLDVLGLNVGDHNGDLESFAKIQSFATTAQIKYPLGRASSPFITEVYRLSKQSVVPQTLLIDREGHLRAIFVGAGQHNYDMLAEQIQKVMSE